MNARILLLLLLLPAAATAQRQVMTLDALTRIAVENQETIRLRRVEADQARLARESASSALYPRLDVAASYQHISKTGGIDFSIPGFPIPPRRISFGDGNIYETALNLSVPLFMGNRLTTAVDMQRTNELIARQSLDGSITETHNLVTSTYRMAQLARKSLDIYDQQSALVRENLDLRRAMLAEGQALAYDTLVLSTRLAQIAVDRFGAADQYERLILQLMQTAGIDTPFDVAGDVPAASQYERGSTDELTRIAVETRYEMKNLRAAAKLGELGVAASRASYYPTVTAMASLRYARPGVDQITNEWMSYYVAGVNVQWNLWSWLGDRRAVERQELEIRKADLRIAQLTRQLRTQIGILQNDLRDKSETLRLLDRQIALERVKSALTQARAREGLATASDLVDAETSLTTALLRLEQTKIEYALKLAELTAVLGQEAQ